MPGRLTPEDWLREGGPIPPEDVDDPTFEKRLRDLLREPRNALRVLSTPKLYADGLRVLGIATAELQATIHRAAQAQQEVLEQRLSTHPLAIEVLRLVADSLRKIRPGFDVLRGLPAETRAALTQALLDGVDEPFLQLDPAQCLHVAAALHDRSGSASGQDQANPLRLAGAALKELVRDGMAGPGVYVLVALAFIDKESDPPPGWESWLETLGLDTRRIHGVRSGLLANPPEIPELRTLPARLPELLASDAAHELRDMLVDLGFQVDGGWLQAQLALQSIDVKSLDPWPRLTVDQFGQDGPGRARAESILHDALGCAEDAGRAAADPRVWARRLHAESWLKAPVPEVARSCLRNDVRQLARNGASTEVRVLLFLVELLGADGPAAGMAVAKALGLEQDLLNRCFAEYLENGRTPSDPPTSTRAAMHGEVRALGRDRIVKLFAGAEPELASDVWREALQASAAQLGGSLPKDRAWIPGVVAHDMGELGDRAGRDGLEPAWREAVLRADPRVFLELEPAAVIRLAEFAVRGDSTEPMSGSSDAVKVLAVFCDERDRKLRDACAAEGLAVGRLDPLLQSCRKTIMGWQDVESLRPELLDGYRRGQPLVFLRELRRDSTAGRGFKPKGVRKSLVITPLLVVTILLGLGTLSCLFRLLLIYVIAPEQEAAPALLPGSLSQTEDFAPADFRFQKSLTHPDLYVGRDLLTDDCYAALDLAAGGRVGSNVLRVSWNEAARWCADLDALLKSRHPSDFSGNGKFAGFGCRLPTIAELASLEPRPGAAAEWVAEDRPSASGGWYAPHSSSTGGSSDVALPFRVVLAKSAP